MLYVMVEWGERFDYSGTLHIMLQSLGLFYKQWHDIEEFETGGWHDPDLNFRWIILSCLERE